MFLALLLSVKGITALRNGPVSRKSRKLFGPENPFQKLRSAYSKKLVYYDFKIRKGIFFFFLQNFMSGNVFVCKIREKLWHTKCARKGSGVLRKRAPGACHLNYRYTSHNIYMLFTGWEVRIGKNCARGLEYGPRPQAEGRTQGRGHSFSLYGPT